MRPVLAVLTIGSALALAAWWFLGQVSAPDDRPAEHASPRDARSTDETDDRAPMDDGVEPPDGPSAHRELDPAPPDEEAAPEPGPGMSVLVVDAEDRAIAGARLRSLTADWPATAETDEHGGCTLPIPASPEESVHLRVEAEGYVHRQAFWFRLAELRVRLHRAFTLTARVVDADSGRSVPGVEVARLHHLCKGCEPDRVTSDGRGVVTLEEIRIGAPSLFSLIAPGYPAAVRSVQFREPPVGVHELPLEPGIEVRGDVHDFSTGAPVRGAVVSARGPEESRSDESGRFSVLVRREREELSVRAEGYCSVEVRLAADRDAPPPSLELRVPLLRPAGLSGRVLDAGGAPLADLRVRIRRDHRRLAALTESDRLDPRPPGWPEHVDLDQAEPRAKTDDQGRFHVMGLLPNSSAWSLEVGHDEHRPLAHPIAAAPGPGEVLQVEVQLEARFRGGPIEGRLTLNDEPVEGGVAWRGPTSRGYGQCEEDGSFVLEEIEPGEVVLTVLLDDYPSGSEAMFAGLEARLEVSEDQPLHHDFELRHAVAPIAGSVRREDRTPVAGEGLGVSRDQPPLVRLRAETDEDGRFHVLVPVLDDGYDVHLSVDGIETSLKGIMAGEEDVEVVIATPGTLLFRALDEASGEPLTRFELCYRTSSQPNRDPRRLGFFPVTDPEGWIEYSVPAGAIDLFLSAHSSGHRSWTREAVQIPPGGTTELSANLLRGLEVEVRLAEGERPLPSDALLFLVEEAAWEELEYERYEGGSSLHGGVHHPGSSIRHRSIDFTSAPVRLRGLSPGLHRFKCFAEGDLTIEPERLDVQQNTTVTIRWRR